MNIIIDPERWDNRKVTIYGIGGVGSYLTRLLVLDRSVPNVTAVDPDVFEQRNLANQWCEQSSIGNTKGQAIGELLQRYAHAMNRPIRNFDYEQRYGGAEDQPTKVVFLATDSAVSRLGIVEAIRRHRRTDVLFDVRVDHDPPQIRVYCINPRSERELSTYVEILEKGRDTVRPSCGALFDSSISQIAAGFAAQTFDAWWRYTSYNEGERPLSELVIFPLSMDFMKSRF